ncbi:uncharacterized protein PG998_015096 [Apiospora kogelbergensis]|uniref:C2H2-type domain-containing protein n=1 Tax=Apiospora kogelbergensis TaxID=1337665 RepID=A0AAW0R5L7_9PEZI
MSDPALRYYSPSLDCSDSEDWRARPASDNNGPGSQFDPSIAKGYDFGGEVWFRHIPVAEASRSATPDNLQPLLLFRISGDPDATPANPDYDFDHENMRFLELTELLAPVTDLEARRDSCYRCPDSSCGKSKRTARDLKKHYRIHAKPVYCPFKWCRDQIRTKGWSAEQRDMRRHVWTAHEPWAAFMGIEKVEEKCNRCGEMKRFDRLKVHEPQCSGN